MEAILKGLLGPRVKVELSAGILMQEFRKVGMEPDDARTVSDNFSLSTFVGLCMETGVFFEVWIDGEAEDEDDLG